MTKKRCLVAMSGGVDSSVAAALMQQADYECVGVTMMLLPPASLDTPFRQGCDTLEDFSDTLDAERVCEQLGMPHYTLDVRDSFAAQVIEPFVKGYCAGYTPNPCIDCNRHIKFGVLYDWAKDQGFDCLATGHYARIEEGKLLKAVDLTKDQSYVLYALTSEQRDFVQLPLGSLSKEYVRRLARELGLQTAGKQESQDICFVPDGNYAGLIERLAPHMQQALPGSGAIVNQEGALLGTHKGIYRYTIGQRKGLGVSGPEPLYVVDIKAATAEVIVGTESERGKDTAIINKVNLLDAQKVLQSTKLTAKHRYRGREHEVRLVEQRGETYRIMFSEKQSDITRGQALVLYNGDEVALGGTIIAVE